MKMYDDKKSSRSISETEIDQNYKTAGLADGTLVERDATFDESVSVTKQSRAKELPGFEEHLFALYYARQGNPQPLADLDQRIGDTLAKYPDPQPASESVPEPAPVSPEPQLSSAPDAPDAPADQPASTQEETKQ